MKRIADTVLDHPRLIVAVYLILAALGATLLPRLTLENSFATLIVQNVPPEVAEVFNQTVKRYGSDRIITLGIRDPEIFTPDGLARLTEITNRIEALKDIEQVRSIANLPIVIGLEDEIRIEPVMDAPPETQEEADAIRNRALANRFLRDVFVGESGDAVALHSRVRVQLGAKSERYMDEMVRAIRAIAGEHYTEGQSFFISGGPALTEGLYTAGKHDLKINVIAPILLNILILFIIFRHLTTIALPLIAVGLSTLLTVAIVALYDPRLNMLTLMLPVLIQVIAVADVIHVIIHYYEELAEGREKRDALETTIRRIGPPCLLTSITTAIGFGSFLFAEMPILQSFSWMAAAGALIAFAVSITFIPAVLMITQPPPFDFARLQDSGRTTLLLERIAHIAVRRSTLIFLVSLILGAASIWGLTRLRVESSLREYFKDDAPVRQAFWFNDEAFGGSAPLTITVKGQPGDFKDPANLRFLEDLAVHLETNWNISRAYTLSEYVAEMNRVLNEGREEEFRIPDSRTAVAQLLFLAENADDNPLENLVDFDYSEARVQAMAISVDTANVDATVKRARDWLAHHLPPHLTAEFTGTMHLSVTMADRLMDSQIRSLFIAFGMIALLMLIVFGSLSVGLLSVIPNILPITISLGVMALSGVSLNVSTILIAGISLGIAVDDTIHYLSRYIREFHVCGDHEQASYRATHYVGRALLFTSLILVGGFVIVVFSSLKPPAHFGLFTALAILVALLADLLLTPALMVRIRPRISSTSLVARFVAMPLGGKPDKTAD